MYIFRWLLAHPIISIWLLTGMALVLLYAKNTDQKDPVAEESTENTTEGVEYQEAQTVIIPVDEVVPPEASDTAAEIAANSENSEIDNTTDQRSNTEPSSEKQNDTPAEEVASETEATAPEQSAESILLEARQAYWNNELDVSVGMYTLLIGKEPDNFSHKGELANVYLKQGDTEQAARIYIEILEPMADAGYRDEIIEIYEFISVHQPKLAAGIKDKLPE